MTPVMPSAPVVPRIEIAGHDDAGPTAHSRQDGDVFVSIRPAVGDRPANDPRAQDIRTDERRAGDVADGLALPVHAKLFVRYVHKTGQRREGRWIPVLEAGRGRADVVHHGADLGELVRVHHGSAGLNLISSLSCSLCGYIAAPTWRYRDRVQTGL
jgi:hypothetical protein